MKAIVVLGPPGVGKGTQCSLLSSRLGANHLSTGSLIRKEISSRSQLGLKVQEIVESGRLVDDSIIFQCVKHALEGVQPQQPGLLIFDGVPRNIAQVGELDSLLSTFGLRVTSVLFFSARFEDLIHRFETRWTCSSCGSVVSAETNAKPLVCASCGKQETLYRRKDDTFETVKRRFEIYELETAPLVSHYRRLGLLQEMSGLDEPEHIYTQVVRSLDLDS